MKRISWMVLGVLLIFPAAANADEASKRAKLEEMFIVLKMDSLMNQMMDQAMSQSQQMATGLFGGKGLTERDQKRVDQLLIQVKAVIKDTLSWEKLKPDYLDLYSASYTEEEVEGVLAFYKSPVGQAVLAKTPELVTKSNQLVTAHAQELQPRLRKLLEDFQHETSAGPDTCLLYTSPSPRD